MNNPIIHICHDFNALGHAAAIRFTEIVNAGLQRQATYHIALSGGQTAYYFFKALAKLSTSIPWEKLHFYFADERFVPADHQDSNYLLAQQELFKHVSIAPEQIHRVKTEFNTAAKAAQNYIKESLSCLPKGAHGEPVFDLILLGMGPDGHTASLFPETEILKITDQPAAAVYVEELNSWRISLTFPVLNSAKYLLFLVGGANKAAIVKEALEKPNQITIYPIQRLNPIGTVEWYLDTHSAALLSRS